MALHCIAWPAGKSKPFHSYPKKTRTKKNMIK